MDWGRPLCKFPVVFIENPSLLVSQSLGFGYPWLHIVRISSLANSCVDPRQPDIELGLRF